MPRSLRSRAVGSAVAVLLSGSTVRSPLRAEAPPVTVTSAASVKALAPGAHTEVTVLIDIAEGWHINAAEPGLSFLIPTSLQFELPSGARVGEIRYPQPETRRLKLAGDKLLHLYRGRVAIVATVFCDAVAKPPSGLSAVLRYQACNDTLCLRPTSVRLSVPIEFVSGQSVTEPAGRARACALASRTG